MEYKYCTSRLRSRIQKQLVIKVMTIFHCLSRQNKNVLVLNKRYVINQLKNEQLIR